MKRYTILEILSCIGLTIFTSVVLIANFFFISSRPIAGLFLFCAVSSLYWMNLKGNNVFLKKNTTILWLITALYTVFQILSVGAKSRLLSIIPFVHCLLCTCYFLFSCMGLQNMVFLMKKETEKTMTEKDVPKLLIDSLNIIILTGTFWAAFLVFPVNAHVGIFALYCLNSSVFLLNKIFVDKEPEEGMRYSFGIMAIINLVYVVFSIFFFASNPQLYYAMKKVESFLSINWILPSCLYYPRALYLSGNNKVEKMDAKPFGKQKGKLFLFLFLWISSILIVLIQFL